MASSSTTHQVVGEHHSWVVQLLRRKLSGQEQAMDLAQDTFVRILSSGPVPIFREPRAYLTTVASRLCGPFRQALKPGPRAMKRESPANSPRAGNCKRVTPTR
ncbi:hypothetical protein LRS56_30495 [Pseudomonas poae]|nr:hypothetical protein LRS56_30495 [Pseudomonas poae]